MASRSASSGDSWRSSTWRTRLPCPSCSKMTTMTATTTTPTPASRKGPPISPCYGRRHTCVPIQSHSIKHMTAYFVFVIKSFPQLTFFWLVIGERDLALWASQRHRLLHFIILPIHFHDTNFCVDSGGGFGGCVSRRFSSATREKVLRWLFPKAELCPLLDSAGTVLQRCLVTHNTDIHKQVSPKFNCITN